ncbi:MAG: hypothetical protein HQL37_03535 [Alphaproteobacteria bacterium]|nr:hypothetical protein [Alphaproteobacteria bacterium]
MNAKHSVAPNGEPIIDSDIIPFDGPLTVQPGLTDAQRHRAEQLIALQPVSRPTPSTPVVPVARIRRRVPTTIGQAA